MRAIYSLITLIALGSCLDYPEWKDARDAGGDVVRRDSAADSTTDIEDVLTKDVLSDISDIPDSDISHDANQRDTSSQPNPPDHCSIRTFDDESDIADMTWQEGMWVRNPEGYVQQTEGGTGGWRTAYFDTLTSDDFEASLRIRMREDLDPQVGVVNKHTGLLFRYSRNSRGGLDPELDHGYVLQMEYFDGDAFDLSLNDIGKGRIESTRMHCGSIGCQHDRWYELKVRAVGSNITAYLNGERKFSVFDEKYSSGHIGFACHAFGQSHFDDLQVCRENDNCVVIFHFDNPDYLESSCDDSSLIDHGSEETASPFGQARRFDGQSHMELLYHPKLDLIESLTVEAMVKPLFAENSFTDSFGNIVTKAAGTADDLHGYVLWMRQGYVGGNIGFFNGEVGEFHSVNTAYELPTDRFTHLALTYDGRKMRLYIDSALKDEKEPRMSIYHPSPLNLLIGGALGGNRFIGDIDEVKLRSDAKRF